MNPNISTNHISKSFSIYRNDISSTIDAGFKKIIVHYKIILIGDVCVGKTCLLYQYTTQSYKDQYRTSISVISKKQLLNLNQQTVSELEIFDTCGEERFRSIVRSYFQGKDGIVLVYDITRKSTFDNLGSWLNEIKEAAPENVGIILVGNKTDNEDEREVSTQMGENFAKKHEMEFIEVSAKTGNRVGIAFEKLASMIHKKKEEEKSKGNNNDNDDDDDDERDKNEDNDGNENRSVKLTTTKHGVKHSSNEHGDQPKGCC